MGLGEAPGALGVFSRPRHRVLLSQHFCTWDDPTFSGVLRGVDAVDGCVPVGRGAWGAAGPSQALARPLARDCTSARGQRSGRLSRVQDIAPHDAP